MVIPPSTSFGDFTGRCYTRHADGVEIVDIRRRKLRLWIAQRFEGKAQRFAKSIERPQPQIAELLSGKRSFGEKLARLLETQASMPPGWLDRDDAGPGEQRLLYHGVALTRAGALLGAEWEKLDLTDRIEIEEEIRQRVQKKIVDERRRTTAAAPAPPKDPPS